MTDLPITKLTSLQIASPINPITGLATDTKQGQGGFSVAQMTAVQRDALINNPAYTVGGIALPVLNGTIVYNTTTDSIDIFEAGAWVEFNTGNGNVAGPDISVVDNIVTWSNITGTAIKNSGVAIGRVPEALLRRGELKADVPLYQISNLGALQFGDSTSTGDTGVILVDSLTAVTVQENGANACTIVGSGLPVGSSSSSATLEINTDEGALLHARLTTAQMKALVNPVAGMEIYNTDTKQLMLYSGTAWALVGGGGGGNVVGPNGAISGDIPIFADSTGLLLKDSGVSIDSSGDISSPGTVAAIAFDLDSADGANNAIGLVAPNLTKSYNLIFPSAAPTAAGQALITGTPGATDTTLSWGSGGIVGPATSVDNNIVSFNGTSGKIIQDSGLSTKTVVGKYLSPVFSSFISTYNIQSNDFFVVVYAASGGTVVTLPSLGDTTNVDRLIIIKQAGVGTTTIYPTSPDAIQAPDQSKYVLSTNEFVWLVGTNNRYWMPICESRKINAINTPLNSGINITTDDEGNNTVDLSFATINPTINGDIVEFSKAVKINPVIPYNLDSPYGFSSLDSSGVSQPGITGASLIMTGSVVTSRVNTISSKNIKSILSEKTEDITAEVCELFKKINLVKYEYKDRLKHGTGIHYGVIAEEIKHDFPHLVQDMQEAIPNIMRKGKVEYINSTTIRINFDTEQYWADEVIKGKKVTIFSEHNIQIKDLIIESICGTDELVLSTANDLPKGLNQVFVYGTEENCPAVAKERLFEMGLCVMQNLMNQLQNLTTSINNLEQKLGAKII